MQWRLGQVLAFGAPAPLELRWRQVPQRRVPSLGVVIANVLDDRMVCLISGLEMLPIDAFNLQRLVDRPILIAIRGTGLKGRSNAGVDEPGGGRGDMEIL